MARTKQTARRPPAYQRGPPIIGLNRPGGIQPPRDSDEANFPKIYRQWKRHIASQKLTIPALTRLVQEEVPELSASQWAPRNQVELLLKRFHELKLGLGDELAAIQLAHEIERPQDQVYTFAPTSYLLLHLLSVKRAKYGFAEGTERAVSIFRDMLWLAVHNATEQLALLEHVRLPCFETGPGGAIRCEHNIIMTTHSEHDLSRATADPPGVRTNGLSLNEQARKRDAWARIGTLWHGPDLFAVFGLSGPGPFCCLNNAEGYEAVEKLARRWSLAEAADRVNARMIRRCLHAPETGTFITIDDVSRAVDDASPLSLVTEVNGRFNVSPHASGFLVPKHFRILRGSQPVDDETSRQVYDTRTL